MAEQTRLLEESCLGELARVEREPYLRSSLPSMMAVLPSKPMQKTKSSLRMPQS